jgi:hypothetical protein
MITGDNVKGAFCRHGIAYCASLSYEWGKRPPGEGKGKGKSKVVPMLFLTEHKP